MLTGISIEAFTDGGFSSSTRMGGWAYSFSYVTPKGVKIVTEDSGGAKEESAQTMEVTAVLKCLNALPIREGKTLLCSDSNYTMSSLGEHGREGWIKGWLKNGWKKSNGDQVVHRKLFEQILERLKVLDACKMQVTFRWVKGHAGIEGNENVDKLVKEVVFGSTS